MMDPCVPDTLPLENLDWVSVIPQIGVANAALARYDGLLQSIVNPAILLAPLTTREAVLSSRIEGTLATIEEVLEFEASEPEEDTPRYADINEILNYRRALAQAQQGLDMRPISLNMVRSIHATLLRGVRGSNMALGEFRTVQNYIGRRGTTIDEASFVPPEPDGLMNHLANLETYIHFNEKDRLVQLAVVHGQFEVIHPFLDGNGRVGRILIPIFLYAREILSSPMFYLSSYLESHREEYCDRLRAITDHGDWVGWINFFLNAIVNQAEENGSKARSILSLYDQMKKDVPQIARSQFAIQALDALFYRPIFSRTDFVKRSDIPRQTALRILRELVDENVLVVFREGSGRKSALLGFPALLDIVE
jgi:Fic family protein